MYRVMYGSVYATRWYVRRLDVEPRRGDPLGDESNDSSVPDPETEGQHWLYLLFNITAHSICYLPAGY